MTGLDLTKATQAGAKQLAGNTHGIWAETDTGYQCFCGHHSAGDQQHVEHRTQAALTAALPHIEKQIRAQIVSEIKRANYLDWKLGSRPAVERNGYDAGMVDAARIAEGETK